MYSIEDCDSAALLYYVLLSMKTGKMKSLNDFFTLVSKYPSGIIGYTYCSNAHHPTNYIDLARVAELKELNYYNVDMHNASFVLPEFIRKMLSI